MAKRSILILEDDPNVSKFIEISLRKEGYQLFFAENGQEGLEILEETTPLLIILDLKMPVMDGIAFLEKIRLKPTDPYFVTVITAHGDNKDVERCYELGVNSFVRKPILPVELRGTVKRSIELKELESNLKKSEEQYRVLVENSMDCICHLDLDGKVLYMNEAGIKANELENFDVTKGMSCLETVKKEYHSLVKNHLERAKKGELTQLIYVSGTNSGREICWESSINPVKDERGNVASLIRISRDITSRIKAEEEVRKLSRCIEQSPNTIMITDSEGRIEYVNPAFTRITGYKPDEAIGKKPRILKSGEASAEEYQQLWETILAGKDWRGIFHNKKKNGDLYWESNIISPVKNTEGTITHFIAVKEDITEHRLSEEREKHQTELLAHANRMTSLGTLAAGMGHEINNPNNFVLLNASLVDEMWGEMQPLLLPLQKEEGEAKKQPMPVTKAVKNFPNLIKGILNGGERINNIVRSLRDFSRMDPSNYQEKILIKDAIHSAAELLKSMIKRSTKHFNNSVESNLPTVRGNCQKLEQVFVNLITNACHALTDTEQVIEITGLYDESRRVVILQVKDEGKGMEPDTLRRVMEPFFTTKLSTGGSGLGVAISYGIVKEHGGVMEYESEPEKGTTVTITLPVAP